ncbi:MAG: LytR C-terminal domain-containing protein [Bacteroidota bacterium]|nr:LytR C-terminal domain-containing protein [Bacteroidota bacterium]
MTGNTREKKLHPATLLLNVMIVVLAAVVIFLLYSFVNTTIVERPVEYTTERKADTPLGTVIQLEVLNGCGVSGVAQVFTEFLRRRRFDVVQAGNYTSFDVVESLVIDRVGDRSAALKVARALGIDEKNIVSQINPDYYLHVSVVIGRDYQQLKPYQ